MDKRETRTFRHRRTAEGAARFLRLWPESGDQGTKEVFEGTADFVQGVVVVGLYGGEQVVVLAACGEQGGATTAARLDLDVDDARLRVTSLGQYDGAARRLAKDRLPEAALAVVEDWLEMLD